MEKAQAMNQSISWESLREEGLKHLQTMTGHLWTDYDIHDPGVTIFETLCYGIMDLEGRLSQNIADILADNTKAQQFFSPREILTINPVTINDYRKLLIDIPGVKNAWLSPAPDTEPVLYYDKDNNALLYDYVSGSERIAIKGLYRLFIEKDDEYLEKNALGQALPLEDGELQRRVTEKLQAHRNLCEEFVEVNVMKPEIISVFSDIQIEENADANEVMPQIYYDLKNFISPRVKQYSLKRMFQKGKSTEEIFNGPPLANGFIDDEELGTGAKKRELHTSDLIRIIMAHPEVKDVKNLFISNVPNPDVNEKKEWALVVDDTKALLLEPFSSTKIRLFKNETMCPIGANEVIARIAALKEQSAREIFDDPAKDLEEILGQDLNLTAYHSLAYKLPSVYGVSETGLPSTVSAQRKAQAKQLRAYLLFFEQLLMNYLKQLDSFKRIFALRQDRDTLLKSYFSELLPQLLWEADFPEIVTKYEFQEDDPDGSLLLSDNAFKRKNRILNHLLAQFNEKFADYAVFGFKYNMLITLEPQDKNKYYLQAKADFLENYPQLSRDRNRAYNYFTQTQGAAFQYTDGLKDLIAAKLGLDVHLEDPAAKNEAKNFYIVEHILFRPDGSSALDFVCNEKIGEEFQPDPYSYQLTFVIPKNIGRFVNSKFKELVYTTIENETPAHISYRIRELDPGQLRIFSETYQQFLQELQNRRKGLPDQYNRFRSEMMELLGIGQVKLPVLHFDAHNIQGNNTELANETYVTGWADLSRNSHDASLDGSGSEASQPRYIMTGNLPLIQMSGGFRFKVPHIPVQDDFSIIVVYRTAVGAGHEDQYFTMLTGADSAKHNYHLAFKGDGAVAGCLSWTTDNILPAVRPKNGDYLLTGGSGSTPASVVIPLSNTINGTAAYQVKSLLTGEAGNGVKVTVAAASDHNDSHFNLVVVGSSTIQYENLSISRRDVNGNGENYIGNVNFSQSEIVIRDINTKFNEMLSLESTTGLFHMAIFTREKTSGEIKLSLDGALQTSLKLPNSSLPLGQSILYIGPAGSGGTCELGEIIILDSVLSDNQKQKLEEYLAAKWQISLTAVSSISKPVLHLDAGDLGSIIRDEKTRQISRWNDVSPAGMDATPKAAKISPEYLLEGIGGLPSVYFENPKLIPWSELVIPNRETVLRLFTRNTDDFIVPIINAALSEVMRGKQQISFDAFIGVAGVDPLYSMTLWKQIRDRGFIDDQGIVASVFKPDKPGFTLGLDAASLGPIQAEFERRISSILSVGKESNQPVAENAFTAIGGINQTLSLAIWTHLKTDKYLDDSKKVLKVFTKNTKDFIVPIIERAIMNVMSKMKRNETRNVAPMAISPDSFTAIIGISHTLSDDIGENLRTNGYIDNDGKILAAFKPDEPGFTLGLDSALLEPVQAEFERQLSTMISNFSNLRMPVKEDTFTSIGGMNLALSQAIRTGLIGQGFINDTGEPKLFEGDSFTIAVVYQTEESSLWGEGRLLDGTATQAEPGKTSWSIAIDAHNQIIVHGGNETVTLAAPLHDAHMAIITGEKQGNQLKMGIYLDGKSFTVGYFSDVQLFRNCPADLAIGRSRTGANAFAGQIGEIIIYDQALTVWDRQRLEKYLSQKWGADISGVDRLALPILHLDASRLATVTTDITAKVTRWGDLSYYSNHAIQESFSRRPKFTGSGMNGLGSILFTQAQTDTEDFYEDSLTIQQIIQNDFTMMVVFKPDHVYYSAQGSGSASQAQGETRWTDGVALVDADCSGIFNDFGLSFQLLNDKIVVMGGIGDRLTGDHTIKTRPIMLADSHFVTFTRCQATGEVKLYADGMLHAEADLRDNVILNDSRSIKIGAYNSEGNPFHGQMGEIIIFNKVLTDKQRQSIEKYLSVKWRIPYVSLPINITNLGLHLDAANFDSIRKEPDHTVSGWVFADTTASITATQAIVPNRPLYVEDSVNGMPGIRFNNSFMTVVPNTTAYDDLTVACVFNPLSIGNISPDPNWSNGAGLLDNYAGTGAQSFGLAINRNKEFTARIGTERIGTPVSQNSPHIAVMTRMKSTGEVRLYVDGLSVPGQPGQQFASNTSLNDISRELTIGAIRILANQTVSKGYYHGDLAELVLFNRALPIADRQMLEKHLSMKWRIDITGINYLVKPALHLDASLVGTMKIEDNKISQWLDVDGHSTNAIQTKPDRRPTYVSRADAYHGLGVVHFDSQQRQCLTLKPVVKDDFTTIIVYRAENQTADDVYKPVSKDSFMALTGNNDKQAGAVVAFLEENGYIDPGTWQLLPKFEPSQPGFTLNLALDTVKAKQTRNPIQGKIEYQISSILSECADAGTPVSADAFAEIGGLDEALSETIWSSLLQLGYINEQGAVLKTFTQNTVSFIIPVIESAISNVIQGIVEAPVPATQLAGIAGIDGDLSSEIRDYLKSKQWLDNNWHLTPGFTPNAEGFTLGLSETTLSVIRAEFSTKISAILSRYHELQAPVPDEVFTLIQGVDLELSQTIKFRLYELKYIDLLGYYLKDFTDVPVTFYNSIIELAIIQAILAVNRVARGSFTGVYGINGTLSTAIWAKLLQKDYINSVGAVLPKFNPGQAGFRLDLGILEPAQAKVENQISAILTYYADREAVVPADAFTSKPDIPGMPDIPDLPGFNQELSQAIRGYLNGLGYIDDAGLVLKSFTKNTQDFIIPVIETAIINVILAEHWISGVGLFDGNCPGVREDMYKRDFGILIGKSGALTAGIGVPGEKDSEVEVPASFNAVHIGVLTRKKDTGMVRLYVDNNASDPVRIARNVILKDSDRFTIGAVNTGGNYFKGDIAEIIVLDQVLEASEITAVQRYLAKKWEVAGIGE